MISYDQIGTVQSDGGVVIGDDGLHLGRIGRVFLDEASRQPAWMTVTSEAWDGAELVVPLALAVLDDGRVSVPYSAAVVGDAPRVDSSRGGLGSRQESDLLRHYGLGPTGDPAAPATTAATAECARPQAHDDWSLPSTGSSIRALRLRLRPFLDVTGLPGEELDDLVLAACEAAANAIEHAQNPSSAFFDVCVDVDGRQVQITIRDHGRWLEPKPGRGRGRGFLMMRNLSSLVVTVEPRGTTVTLRNGSAAPGYWSVRRRA